MWLWIKHETFKTEPPSKRTSIKGVANDPQRNSTKEPLKEFSNDPRDSINDLVKETTKETFPAKKQLQTLMRFKKNPKAQPASEKVLETIKEVPVPLIEEVKIEEPYQNKFFELKSKTAFIESEILRLKQEINEGSSSKLDDSHTFVQKKFENGSVYIGEWENSMKDGRGKCVWPNGDVYDGDWVKDKQHGKGKSTWTAGNSFIGFFENNEKAGLGEYIWIDGSSYIGEWKNNKMNGIGRHRWKDGREYVGEWLIGERQGLGIMTYKNGNRYEGEFKRGKPDGQGVLVEPGGKSVSGLWRDGKLVKND